MHLVYYLMSSSFLSPGILYFISHYGYLAVSLGIGIESIGIPFPGETIVVAAAVYAGAGYLSLVWVIVFASIGAILGDNIGYVLGMYGGRRFLERFGKHIRIHPKHLEHAEAYFKKHGGKTVFWGRFVSILRMWSAFLAGTHRMPWQTFLYYNALGGIVWSIVFGFLGYTLGKNLSLLSMIIHTVGIIGIGVIIVLLIFVYKAWKRILQGLDR